MAVICFIITKYILTVVARERERERVNEIVDYIIEPAGV